MLASAGSHYKTFDTTDQACDFALESLDKYFSGQNSC